MDPVHMTADHTTLLFAAGRSGSNISATASTDTSAESPDPLQRRLLRPSSVVGSSNENNSTGESVTKELTWSMLEKEDVFLANEVND